MKVASITWDAETDVTKIEFSDEFLESENLVHADVLSDAMVIMEPAYNHAIAHLLSKEKNTILQKEMTA